MCFYEVNPFSIKNGYGASDSCAGAAMIDFLVNGTVPAKGTTCDAGPQQAAGGAEG